MIFGDRQSGKTQCMIEQIETCLIESGRHLILSGVDNQKRNILDRITNRLDKSGTIVSKLHTGVLKFNNGSLLDVSTIGNLSSYRGCRYTTVAIDIDRPLSEWEAVDMEHLLLDTGTLIQTHNTNFGYRVATTVIT